MFQWLSLEFAPDGKRLYAVSGEGCLVLDVETGQESFAKKAPPKKKIYSGRLALSPDGTRLAHVEASAGMMSLLNAETGPPSVYYFLAGTAFIHYFRRRREIGHPPSQRRRRVHRCHWMVMNRVMVVE